MIEKAFDLITQGDNIIWLFVMVILSFFIIILFAVGSMAFVKFKQELKKLNDDNGHRETDRKIDKLFSMYSEMKSDIHYIKGKIEILTQSTNKVDK